MLVSPSQRIAQSQLNISTVNRTGYKVTVASTPNDTVLSFLYANDTMSTGEYPDLYNALSGKSGLDLQIAVRLFLIKMEKSTPTQLAAHTNTQALPSRRLPTALPATPATTAVTHTNSLLYLLKEVINVTYGCLSSPRLELAEEALSTGIEQVSDALRNTLLELAQQAHTSSEARALLRLADTVILAINGQLAAEESNRLSALAAQLPNMSGTAKTKLIKTKAQVPYVGTSVIPTPAPSTSEPAQFAAIMQPICNMIKIAVKYRVPICNIIRTVVKHPYTMCAITAGVEVLVTAILQLDSPTSDNQTVPPPQPVNPAVPQASNSPLVVNNDTNTLPAGQTQAFPQQPNHAVAAAVATTAAAQIVGQRVATPAAARLLQMAVRRGLPLHVQFMVAILEHARPLLQNSMQSTQATQTST